MATEWLAPLGLKRGFGFSQGVFVTEEVPDWAGFLIWAGWWMRRAQVSRTRTFMVILLPDRAFAAPLVALGAMIGSLGRTGRSLSWEQFLELPVGTSVFLRMKDRAARFRSISVEGRVGAIDSHRNAAKGTIALVSDQARFRGALILPSRKAFFEYDVSLTRHATPRKARKLLGVSRIFSELSNDFEESWMIAPFRESAVVTNRARWTRLTADLQIVLAGDPKKGRLAEEMEKILLCGMPSATNGGRTLLVSPKTPIPESIHIPVGVLDGAEALRSLDLVLCPNIVVLLEQSEYEKDVQDQLAGLNSVRNDDGPEPTDIPREIPGGIDVAMFAFSTAEE